MSLLLFMIYKKINIVLGAHSALKLSFVGFCIWFYLLFFFKNRTYKVHGYLKTAAARVD